MMNNDEKIMFGLEKIEHYSSGINTNLGLFKAECNTIKPLIEDKIDKYIKKLDGVFEKYFKIILKESDQL